MRFDYKTRELEHKRGDSGTMWLAAISIICIAVAVYIKTHKILPVAVAMTPEIVAPDAVVVLAAEQVVAPVLPKPMWASVTIENGDSIARIFNRLNIPASTLSNLLHNKLAKKHLTKVRPGQEIRYCVTKNTDSNKNSLHAIEVSLSQVKSLRFAKNNAKNTYSATAINQPIETRMVYGSNKIDNSLFVAAKKAGLNNKLIMQLVDIFGSNIDFSRVRPHDSFHVLFEEKYVAGTDQKIAVGNIIAAEFKHRGTTHKAIRHTSGQYFDQNGNSMQQAFLRAPVKYTRISSHFNPKRFHPVKKKICPHRGVDFVARTGTPVMAAANGKIAFIGNQRGYGKIILIKHDKKNTTAYAHLSKFAKLKVGSRVKRGDIIGKVGMTGWATAPHLHYEFRVKGVHKDPMKVKLPRKTSIGAKAKPEFLLVATDMLQALDSRKTVMLAQN